MMKQKAKYSTRWLAFLAPAVASKYLAHVVALKPCPVVLYLRVSSRGQEEHLDDLEKDLVWELESKGFEVVAVFKEVISGSADDRAMLQLAILEAERTGAIVVTESADRYLRHPEFDPKTNPYVLPTVF